MPGQLSKSFYAAFADKTCADILHPGLSCRANLKRTLVDAVQGSLKFYFPICAAPLLFKNPSDSTVWKEFFRDIGKCFVFGFCLSASSLFGVCGSYNYFQRFFLPFLMTVPVSLSSLLCFTLPPHILKVEGQGLFNMYLEFLIRRSRFKLIESLRESKAAATVIFSILHSFVMFGFLRYSTKNFWFASFKLTSDDETLNRCKKIHEKLTCREYFQQELKKTAKFAFGLSMFKVLPKLLALWKTPTEIPMKLIQKFDYGLVMFFLTINALFKSMFCFLNRSTTHSTEVNCIISALLSGVGFWFYPRYIVFTMAMTNSVETAYNVAKKKFEEKRRELPKVIKLIDKIPIVYLMFLVCAGLDLQLRFLYPSLVNKFTFKILSLLTNGRGDRIVSRFVDILLGFK